MKEEVRIGLGFDWAVMGLRVLVKRRRIGRKMCVEAEKERILWDEGPVLYLCIKVYKKNVGS